MKLVKIRTLLVAGLAGGAGYVLGSKAGTERYEQIKDQADRLLHNPKVQETVTNAAQAAKQNASKLPDPVANVVHKAADNVTASTDTPTPSSAAPVPAPVPVTGLGTDLSPDPGADLGSEMGGDLGTPISSDFGPDSSSDFGLDSSPADLDPDLSSELDSDLDSDLGTEREGTDPYRPGL